MGAEAIHKIPLASCLPFVIMLAAIATGPLFWQHFWEKNRNKLIIAMIISLPVAVYLMGAGYQHQLSEALVFDYLPFMILLASLFVITGGIYISGYIEAKPLTNTFFLAIGTVLASIMGTTGAVMLLIRPLIQTNQAREYKVHTVMFCIALVANCGGLLTPIGDPPLFILYLRGAPFFWFLKLFPVWLFANGLLLLTYFCLDSYYHGKEKPAAILRDSTEIKPIRIAGKVNFFWLAGVVLSVAFINEQYIPLMRQNHYFKFIREAVILGLAVLSMRGTPRHLRQANKFTFAPIAEVAYLFLGIFVTMVPCLIYFEGNAMRFGVNQPWQFYYATGGLSSLLDNTPTAVAFHSLALGLGRQQAGLVAGIPAELLGAICAAAVFFGAMTYIGNGPNFMVKAIAEENKIKMPHFFSFILKFSLPVLLPVFVLVQLIFF